MDCKESHDLDLPLMANIKDTQVQHFILDLTCDFQDKTFLGTIILFCKPSKLRLCEIQNIVEKNETETIIDHKKTLKSSDTDNVNSFSNSYYPLESDREENKSITSAIPDGTNKVKSSECSIPSNETISDYKEYHEFDHNYTKDSFLEEASKDLSLIPNCPADSHNFGIHVNVVGATKPSVGMVHKELQMKDSTSSAIMTLDAWDLEVLSVHKLCLSSSELHNLYSFERYSDIDKCQLYDCLQTAQTQPMCFVSEKKCIKIWDKCVTTWEEFPEIIRVHYRTSASGPSLKWTQDQDGRKCVYTHGHWINNRSLFPSQDVPVAMATWAAYIHVPSDLVVLMSGDQDPVISSGKEGYSTYYYYTDMVMPSSTLALAVGSWVQTDIITGEDVTHIREKGLSVIPCRLFSPPSYKETARTLLQDYLPRCMEGAQWLLGPHPFSRLDILIVPRSFASLGMASPSLMFLSQSVISPDGAMLVRVAHELSHTWFGLLIGPRDWHEEWLSEGFCTYTEGIVHAKAMQWSFKDTQEHTKLQDYFKYRTLAAEIGNTQQELQTLRNVEEKCEDDSVTYVKNGMNPDKGFMQVHYLKGYFLLRFLETEVGHANFRTFLRSLVNKFHHQLITSMDVFTLFFQTFPSDLSSSITEHTLSCWLDEPGIPKALQRPTLDEIVPAQEAIKLQEKIRTFNKTYLKLHWQKRRKLDMDDALTFPELNNDHILLVLGLLLEENKLHPDILMALKTNLKLTDRNPEVSHRWCELVIKYQVERCYEDIRDFLINHQAMGVYLFGELIVTRDPVQRQLAISTFEHLKSEMEDGICATVHTMVYGN